MVKDISIYIVKRNYTYIILGLTRIKIALLYTYELIVY